jgi:O-antigen biosynthesis protein
VNILIAHPEGNLNYNPNLAGLVELLTQARHRVTYVAPPDPRLDQTATMPGLTMCLLEGRIEHGPLFFPEGQDDVAAWGGYDLIIGIDRGVIEAAVIARHYGVPLALISYEIFFKDECPPGFNDPMIDACRDIVFATCQDSLRSRLLCEEYGIPADKVLRMPVAGRGFRGAGPKPRRLHETFGFAADVRTVLHMGSFDHWTRAPFLLQSSHAWPSGWALVIHARYGLRPALRDLVQRLSHPERVFVSEAKFGSLPQMTDFIRSADLGLALYQPTYANRWQGRNIDCIGLGSGKISTYLQHGVPVATHDLGEISDWLRFYGAGQVFALDESFIPKVPQEGGMQACRTLFDEQLNLDRFAGPVLQAVANVRNQGHLPNAIAAAS